MEWQWGSALGEYGSRTDFYSRVGRGCGCSFDQPSVLLLHDAMPPSLSFSISLLRPLLLSPSEENCFDLEMDGEIEMYVGGRNGQTTRHFINLYRE